MSSSAPCAGTIPISAAEINKLKSTINIPDCWIDPDKPSKPQHRVTGRDVHWHYYRMILIYISHFKLVANVSAAVAYLHI